jgi:hypothetical protein
MNISKIIIASCLIIASSSVMAADGSMRSQAMVAKFRADQARIHGTPQSAVQLDTADKTAPNKAINSEPKAKS